MCRPCNRVKFAVLAELVLLSVVLQALKIGAESLFPLVGLDLPNKIRTMCVMAALWLIFVLYIRLRRVSLPIFPKKFTPFYIIVTVVVAVLLITAPSNYTGGIIAILELFYGSVVTPVYEETIFRGYMWERISRAFESEKAAFIITTALFTLWHIGYILPNLIKGDIFAVATKLAAALVYGLIIGFTRLKSENLYLPILLHGAMNLFMI